MTDEEMAEEYVKGLCKTCKVDVCRHSKIQTCAIKESLKQAYLAGLKAGRLKWHKADILPSQINKVVLGYIKDYNSKMFCLVKWNGEWWYDARTYNERVKLIAWREIELPKEIKQNDR